MTIPFATSWLNPHCGGEAIPIDAQERVKTRILRYARSHHERQVRELEFTFRRQFCYVDAWVRPTRLPRRTLRYLGETPEQYLERVRTSPVRLCRLRYFTGPERWSVAHWVPHLMRYEPSAVGNAKPFGTPEACFRIGACHL